MAKKIPKTPASGASFPWWTTISGIAGLLNRNPLTTSKITGANTATYGSKAWQAQNMANMAKMGQVSMANTPGFWAKTNLLGNRAIGGLGRFALGRAAMHPAVMIPAAGTMLAKHLVDKSFAPYKDEEGKWTEEGHARALRQRLAREDLVRRIRAAKEEGAGFWELAKMRKNPDEMYENEEYLKHYGNIMRENQLSEAEWKESFNEGGLARLL